MELSYNPKAFEHDQLSEALSERLREVVADHKDQMERQKARGYKTTELVRHNDYGLCGFCLMPLSLKRTSMLKAHIKSEHIDNPVYQQLSDRPDIFDQGFKGELCKVGWCRKLTYDDYAARIEQFLSGQEEIMRISREDGTM